ncbi:peptidoglycan DD-metalloendopeptidase family protein [bacterium]|nr:peptidoglycan DD-metalloendopeptidase family protein [bacterium]
MNNLNLLCSSIDCNQKSFILGLSLIFLFTLPLVSFLGLSGARASGDDEAARDLRTLKQEIQRGRKQGNRARLRRGSVLKEIDDLNRWRSALKFELDELATGKQRARVEVAEQRTEATRLEQSLTEIREKFCQRLKIRYCQPSGKWLDFLAGDSDLTENLNSLVYGQRVLAADKKLQNSYLSLLAEIHKRHQELEKRHLFLAHLEQQQVDKMAALEENIAKKNELLYKIKHQVEAHERLVVELEGVAAKLKRMTLKTESSKSEFALHKGSLPVPVDGVVISFFGIEKDSRFATVTRNKGIEIEAERGSPVKVIYRGQVVFASWMKGYGNLLVVDHGGGYHSVYAHLDKFSCVVNDQLKALDVIGEVGSGVFSETPSLYFEIRQGGVPEDPLVWVSQL